VNELALISNEVTQIATAAEEQSAVTEDLSANMTVIPVPLQSFQHLLIP